MVIALPSDAQCAFGWSYISGFWGDISDTSFPCYVIYLDWLLIRWPCWHKLFLFYVSFYYYSPQIAQNACIMFT